MKRIISLTLCFMLAFTLCQPAFAAGDTITWTGDSSDNWNVAGNWNPEQVPGLGDTAVIPASTGAAVVYDTTSVTLDCSGEVSVESGETLWLTDTSYLKGGKLSGDGNITIMVDNSELQWSGGSIEGNGTFTVAGNTRLVIDTTSDVSMSRPFENNGQVMLNAGDLLLMGGGTGTGTFTVSGGASLHFEQGNYSIGGDFVNRGEMTIWSDSSVGFNAGYWQEDESTLALKVGGTGAGEYCKLDVAGAAVLGGILEVDFISDYVPLPGDSFEIVTCGSRTNEFFEIRNNMEDEVITLVPTYTETGLTLTVSGGAAKVWEVKDATELETALNGFGSGDTIKLLQSIDYTNDSSSFAISIDGDNITFDLSGNNLTINNNSGYGVELRNGAKMTFTDSTGGGKLFINTGASGLSASGGSTFESDDSVTVTINSRIGSGISANEATVNIKDGSVSVSAGYTHGVVAISDCMITVNGPVTVNNVSGSSQAAVYLNRPGNTVNVGSAVVTGRTGNGVFINEGGTVTVGSSVSPSSVTGTNAGIYTMGGSYPTQVTVYGNVEGVSYGIYAFDNTEIEVYGDVTSTSTDTEGCGVYTYAYSGPSSRIEIDGNVEGYDGMEVLGASSIARVTGNVTANGSDLNHTTGVYAEDATAEVGENLYAVSGTGAKAGKNGQITVDGSINATKYIVLRGTEKTIDDKTLPTTKEYYHTYNNDTATVWVKAGGTAEFAGGDGSEDNPYLIATADHLNNVRNHLDKYFRLTANLDLSGYSTGEGWEPIGMSVDFTGSFDGSGHTISGLVVNRPDQDDIGLFGYAETTAKICNIGLVGVNVTGGSYVGGLVGGNRGLVSNSYVTGDVNGESQVGGLVGENLESGTITNCHAKVTVTSSHSDLVGGLVGGLVGENYGAITESYAVGEVEGTNVVGGLVGFSSGNIDKSYATGTVTGTETHTSLYTCVGGLVGNNDGPISNSFARGAVSGQEDIGGLAGVNRGSITNSYSTGAVSGDIYIGGLVGCDYSDDITDSYWDKETSLLNTSAGGTGKTTAEMKQKETFEDWNFSTIWDISTGFNNGYPFLIWQNTEVVTAPTAPQNFTATTGDGQVALSWAAPASDGGSATIKYQVSKDNGASWTDVGLNTSHTFTGLTNGTEYTFKVRAVNSAGNGTEASTVATPAAPAQTTHTVSFYSNGSLYTEKTVTSGSALEINWPANPTRSGYSFGGWYTGQNGMGTRYTSASIIIADIALYAKWTYSSSGGSSGGNSSGGGSSDSGTTVIIQPEKMPDQPVMDGFSVIPAVNSSGHATVTVSQKSVADAIAKAQADAKAQGKSANGIAISLTIDLPDTAKSLGIVLPQTTLKSLVDAGVKQFEINGVIISLDLDLEALKEIQKQSTGDITITIKPAQNLSEAAKKLIGTRPVYDVTFSYVRDSKTVNITSLGNGSAILSIPYTPGKNEVVGYLFGVYADASGGATRINDSAYDANSGSLILGTNHFSVYGVGYTAPSEKYTYIATHWARESIDYAVGRGLFSGTIKKTISPNMAMDRGMLVTVLGRLAGADVSGYKTSSFSDVAAGKYYLPYVEWAYKKGIVSGIGSGKFAPERAVTREKIALILQNYAKATGYTLPVTRETITFADNSSISSPYAGAIMAMQQAGIMVGGSGNKFNPKAGVTRAEVAAMLHRYVKLTIDPATAQGWAKNDDGQYLYYKDGKPLSGWQTIDGVKYYFNSTGVLQTGWVKDGSNWYYFYTDGSLARSTTIDVYEVDENGVRKSK